MDHKTPISVKLETEINDSGQKESIILEANGTKYVKDESLFLAFKEEIEGVGSVQTVVKIKETQISIFRTGAISMRQTYIVDEITVGEYKSFAGQMEVRVRTEEMSHQYNEQLKKGMLAFSYQLYLRGNHTSQHRMNLTYTEV